MSGSNIVFVLTGSIAAYKACDVISQLVQRGHRVRVVATEASRRFVGDSTLEGLTGQRVLSGLFEPGAALEHIDLTRWADLVVICPATANTLNRLAAGLADDLLGALFLAHDRSKPFLVVPAMNPAMWSHPATTASVEKLRGWGVRFVAVGQGRTACGEVGEGRMAEPAEILRAIEARLARPERRLRVLVTSGGTAEPIDAVRVLSNTSTGRTGAEISARLAAEGHEVVLLRARGSVPAGAAVREEIFYTFAEFDAQLGRLLETEEFDAIVHAAAVSDFAVESVEVDGAVRSAFGGKLDTSTAPVLRLRQNPKLVERLRARSRNPAIRVVAFKLTQGASEFSVAAAVSGLFERSGADFIVHNDLTERAGPEAFPADVYQPGVRLAAHCATRTELATTLVRLLMKAPRPPTIPTHNIHAPLP